MKPILVFAVLFMSTTLYSQTLDWTKCLGGVAEDYSSSIQQTTDGGFIVAGSSTSNKGNVTGHHDDSSYNYDFWITKLNASGFMKWQISLGGSGDDIANSIEQTKDGGYIVAGYSESTDGDVHGNHGSYDYWIVKLTSAGIIEWQKSLGGKGYDYAKSIHQTTDGGYIVAGYSNSVNGNVSGNHGKDDYWIVKLSSSGSIEWQECLGGANYDQATAIQQTAGGGYIVAGYSNSKNGSVSSNNGRYDYWIVKLNSTGSLQWETTLGGKLDDLAYAIRQTSDGGYIVAGYSFSHGRRVKGNHGGADYFIIKLKGTGKVDWQKCFGGSNNDLAYSVQQTIDGGYVIGGYSASADGDVTNNNGLNDYWILKLNGTGDFEWQKNCGGTNDDLAYSGQQVTDGSYIIAGSTNSTDKKVNSNHGDYDYWIVKLNQPYIFATANTGTEICNGTAVTCTATLTNASTLGTYQWKKNGKKVGTGKTYTDSNIKNKDSIICIYEYSGTKYNSRWLIFTVNKKAIPTASITVSPGSTICSGTNTTFIATSTDGGTNPKYNWYKNNILTGIKDAVYTDNLLKNGDSIWSVLTSNGTCITTNTATSNEIKMIVYTGIPEKPGPIMGPISVLGGQTNISYSVIATPGFTYSWVVPDGCKITSGAGTASIKVDWGTIGGTVKCAAINTCGQSEKKGVLNVSISVLNALNATEIKAGKTNSLFYAQPNPAKNIVNVNFIAGGDDKYSLQLADATGKILLNKEGIGFAGKNQVTFNLSNYARGVYFITLTTNDNKQICKIIKE